MKTAITYLKKLSFELLVIFCTIIPISVTAQPRVPEDMSMFISHGGLTDFKYSPDGKILATAGAAGLLLWDMENKKLIKNIVDTTNIYCFDWGPDSKQLAVSYGDGNIKIIDIIQCKVLNEFKMINSNYGVDFLDWSPDGTKIITYYQGSTVVIDAITGETLLKFDDEKFQYSFFGYWSPDGNKIAFSRYKRDSTRNYYLSIYDTPGRCALG